MSVSALCAVGEQCLKGDAVFYPGSTFFIDPDSMSQLQLLWAFASYGYVLFLSANMIGDGAELLLLIPSYKDLVASIILPILGAIPDGMMVLFSGIGPLAVAQENVAVGVGALAGSTIMLLTLPWVLSFYGGKVDMFDCPIGYGKSRKSERDTMKGMDILFKSGIEFQQGAKANAIIMMVTSMAYLFIQIPALMVDDQKSRPEYASDKAYLDAVVSESSGVHLWAGIGAVATAVLLAYYLYLQVKAAQKAQQATDEEGGASKGVTYAIFLEAAPAKGHQEDGWLMERGIRMHIQYLRDRVKKADADKSKAVIYEQFLDNKPPLPEGMKKELESVFWKYAKKSAGTSIAKKDMQNALAQIGLDYTNDKFDAMFQKADANKDNILEVNEFLTFFKDNIIFGSESLPWEDSSSGGDDDDDDEVPDEFKNLDPDEQRKAILRESFQKMITGTVLVLIFSDPMVDVMASIGKMTGIPAFYVSFVLAPLASNASELVASFKLASKKSSESITQSLQTLEGAAIMNNTFCLGIFYLLIYMQGLAWKFTAETLSIVVVQLLVGAMVLKQNRQSMMYGIIVFCLYPLSLVLVYVLEANGID